MFGQDEAWTNIELHVWPVPAQAWQARLPPPSQDCHSIRLSKLATPPCWGIPTGHGKEEAILLYHGQGKVWPRRCMNKCWTACLACACPSQEQQDFPLFSIKSSHKFLKKLWIFEKNLMKWVLIDEFVARFGGRSLLGVVGRAWARVPVSPCLPSHTPTRCSPYICLMCHFQSCRKRGQISLQA